MPTSRSKSANPVASIDRVVFESTATIQTALDSLGDFRSENDHALRNINLPFFHGPYGRVKNLVNAETKTRLIIHYLPRYRRLAPVRVSVIPDDFAGQGRRELERILQAFTPYEIVILELALDFPRWRGVNARSVRREVRFGKSRGRRTQRFPRAAWLGAPGSSSFLRAYEKPQIERFRIEAQFNRESLRKNGITAPQDFDRLPEILIRKLGFYRFDWTGLEGYVKRHLRHSAALLDMALRRKGNLTELLTFLRQITVSNPERFLIPMAINTVIFEALEKWGRKWLSDGQTPAVRWEGGNNVSRRSC